MPKRARGRAAIEDYSPTNFRVLGAEGHKAYSRTAIDLILAAASTPFPRGRVAVFFRARSSSLDGEPIFMARRTALIEMLEYTALTYWHDRETSKAPQRSDVDERIKKIGVLSTGLIKALGLDANLPSAGQTIPFALRASLLIYGDANGGHGFDRMMAGIDGLLMIHGWSQRHASLVKRRLPTKLVHKGDVPFNNLLVALADAWMRVFEREPQVSYIGGNSANRNKPCGPFFAFIGACLAPLDVPENLRKDSALAERLSRLLPADRVYVGPHTRLG